MTMPKNNFLKNLWLYKYKINAPKNDFIIERIREIVKLVQRIFEELS